MEFGTKQKPRYFLSSHGADYLAIYREDGPGEVYVWTHMTKEWRLSDGAAQDRIYLGDASVQDITPEQAEQFMSEE